MARRSPWAQTLHRVLVPALVGLGAVAADPPPPPPAEFTAALAKVAELETQAQFAKALREAKALQATTTDPALLGRLRSLVTRLREEDETAVGLDFAIEQLLGADSRSRKTARKKLKDAGDTGRILLRQAMRNGTGALADEAALALLEMGDAKARDYLLKRIHDAPTAPASQRLLRALRPSLPELAPEQFVRVYGHLQQAGTEARFKVRDSVGFLADVYRVVCGEDEARLNQCLGDPKAFATLVAYVEAATDSTDPELKAWADSEGAAFLGSRSLTRWRLDDDTGTTAKDASGNGHHGTLLGGTRWLTAGKLGGALKFDGQSGSVTIPDQPALRLGKAMTLMLWLRADGDSADWVRLLGKGDANNRNYGLWREAGGSILFQISSAGAGGWANFSTGGARGTPGNIAAGSGWHHVAATYDGTTGKVYVDGALVFTGTTAVAPANTDAPVTLGHAGYHAFFNGALDDVRLYDRVLPEADIATEVKRAAARANPPPKAP